MNYGEILLTRNNLVSIEKKWMIYIRFAEEHTRRDSNPQPSDPKSDALSN